MYRLLDKVKAVCAVCGTPLNGANLRRRGDKFYCASDYERTSPQEIQANAKVKRDNKIYKEIIKGSV